MTARPDDLPDFERPPVVEVAIGVQFEPFRGFRQAHVGLIWNAIRDEYPATQDQPRLDAPIEGSVGGVAGATLKIEFVDAPPTHRTWFVSADDSLLLQVQDDRLIHNWRHRGGAYPRFEPLLERFWSMVDTYNTVLNDAGLTAPPIRQVEVTYINWITASSVAEFFRPASTAQLQVPGVGPNPDQQLWSARYPVSREERMVGQLSIDLQQGQRFDAGVVSAGFQMALTFRAPVAPHTERTVMSDTLGIGRETIVRTFADVTTTAMHTEWVRLQ